MLVSSAVVAAVINARVRRRIGRSVELGRVASQRRRGASESDPLCKFLAVWWNQIGLINVHIGKGVLRGNWGQMRLRAAAVVVVVCILVLLGAACSSGDVSQSDSTVTTSGWSDAVESSPAAIAVTTDDEVAADVARGTEEGDGDEMATDTQYVGWDLAGLEGATAATVTLLPTERGDSGQAVIALQDRLAALGFAPGPPDGSYGRKTARAVEGFQELVYLEPTGIADAQTVSALIEYRYDGLVLHAGDEGLEVEELQRRLSDGPFDPGAIDGKYGFGTVAAVWALEKLASVSVDGDWGPLDEKAWQLLMDGEIGKPTKTHEWRWVEFDLSQQLVKVYDPGSSMPFLVSHASSGSGIPWANEDHSGSSITPRGDFTITRRIRGWRESSLNIGRLYNPLYFNGGIAFHGANSVPLYPASHGCVRLPMHIAEYLPGELPNGTLVHVLA